MKKTLRIVASTVMISLVILIIGGIAVFLYLYNNELKVRKNLNFQLC